MAQLHPDTLPRQWQMLRMIPRYPQKITAKALHEKLQAEQFDVTSRSRSRIQRRNRPFTAGGMLPHE